MKQDLYKKFSYKIKKISEIIKDTGRFPRKHKLAMCHGNFDVVHPGHLHHLMYVKNKAHFLVASITKDKYISKGKNRPHVPDHLRAINLAAFEFVDFVIIDENKTPILNLKKLKPDIFAKGFEYNTDIKKNPKTIGELKAVKKYGGQMIFTPGDIIDSSTRLLRISKPNIKKEKVISLFNKFKITKNDVLANIDNFKKTKVHVVGDLIIDTLVNTAVIGVKAKTPTISVKEIEEKSYIGGAGIVAKHLKEAGAEVTFTSLIGNDNLGKWAKNQFAGKKIKVNLLLDETRPTTEKKVVIADNYRLLKIDNLENHEISNDIFQSISRSIKKEKCECVVFSDFRHGIFNNNTIPKFSKLINKKCFKVADSQVASRWGNITDFKNFNLITPNENEARFALGDQDSVIASLVGRLVNMSKCESIFLKLGNNGLLSYRPESPLKNDNFFSMDSYVENLVDSVGAGDALLAYSTLSLLKNNNEILAAFIGSMAAACACEQNGNLPIKPSVVKRKIQKFFSNDIN